MRVAFGMLIAVGVFAAPMARSGDSIVPLKVEQAIVRVTRVYDYLPERLGGYRYHDFSATRHGISVWFQSAGREVGFHSFAQGVPCRSGPGTETGGPMRTFVVDGLRIYWRGTSEDHEAWRCISVRGRVITLEATDSFFGQSALSQRTLRVLLTNTRWLG